MSSPQEVAVKTWGGKLSDWKVVEPGTGYLDGQRSGYLEGWHDCESKVVKRLKKIVSVVHKLEDKQDVKYLLEEFLWELKK